MFDYFSELNFQLFNGVAAVFVVFVAIVIFVDGTINGYCEEQTRGFAF